MYYREFEESDQVQRVSFVELSGRLLKKNKSDWKNSPSTNGCYLDDYYVTSMNGELSQPADVDSDIRRVSFLSKANNIFQATVPPNTYLDPFTEAMEKPRKVSAQTSTTWYPQPTGEVIPNLAVELTHKKSKREAELESAVQILTMKLNYTQKKIMESENNKELLKAKLDHLISHLTKAGYDPHLKARIPQKLESSWANQAHVNRPVLNAATPHIIEPMKNVQFQERMGNGPRTSIASNTTLNKLKELAEEYERRLLTVKSLEEQEKYAKQQLTTPVNITVPRIMGSPRHLEK